jgi:hypothetical protein
MKGKSAQFINENFDYALNLFLKNESERLHELKENAMKHSISKEVDVPKVIEEKHENVEDVLNMNPYLQELSKY